MENSTTWKTLRGRRVNRRRGSSRCTARVFSDPPWPPRSSRGRETACTPFADSPDLRPPRIQWERARKAHTRSERFRASARTTVAPRQRRALPAGISRALSVLACTRNHRAPPCISVCRALKLVYSKLKLSVGFPRFSPPSFYIALVRAACDD